MLERPLRTLWLLAAPVFAISLVPRSEGALSIYVSPEDLAATAPLVLEGTVARVDTGLDPIRGSIATYVEVTVSHVHRGPADLDRIVLREPGGRYKDIGLAIDAVPRYAAGERVFLFLEAGRDGALRTAQQFFGKFSVDPPGSRGPIVTVRDLSGQGTIVGRSDREKTETEQVPLDHLESLVASIVPSDADRVWLAEPPEYPRLLWETSPGSGSSADPAAVPAAPSLLGRSAPDPRNGVHFADFSPPVRWHEADSSTPVLVNIERARNPLGDGPAAVDAMRRAMAAWTGVPEARLILVAGNDDDNFTGTASQSPSDAYPPRNIILFGDPYGDISDPICDPTGCRGTLAIGGYWYGSSPTRTVNQVTFHGATRLFVIFNNGFESFLGNTENLAEVGAHELGHGIGFAHSGSPGALMRATAYGGGRGPRLGDDDRDGAHCHYPHTFGLTSPNGGETWVAGSTQRIAWTASTESGGDAGTVSLEYSGDGGASWISIVAGTANDGEYSWIVPNSPGSDVLVRVIRPNLVSPTPSPYPSACSADWSDGPLTITVSQGPPRPPTPGGISGRYGTRTRPRSLTR